MVAHKGKDFTPLLMKGSRPKRTLLDPKRPLLLPTLNNLPKDPPSLEPPPRLENPWSMAISKDHLNNSHFLCALVDSSNF
uniref:Uncharacterized protein n=1 Tax=Romanomermis culicivorax TaxID=13658 RepID=A0A915KJ41_ROMCU